MAKLIIKKPDSEDHIHELKDDVTTFGRASTNIIQVKDEKASREHCRIVKSGDSFRLEDLGSRNGVTVNGLKVESQTLKVGDVVAIGDWKMIFDEEVSVGAEELFATVGVETIKEEEIKKPLEDTQEPPEKAKLEEKLVLLVTSGPDKGKQVEAGKDKITIGRHSSNTLPLSDESSSNYHAEIVKEAIGYVVVDLGSTNGTLVNGEKTVKSPIAHGTEIKIGQNTIVFKDVNRQVDEEAVFGTVVLDTEQLEKELASAEKGAGLATIGRLAAGVILLGAFAAIAYLIYAGIGRLFKESYEVPEGSLITSNFSFDGETGPSGAPKGWEWDPSRHLIWQVTAEEDRFADPPQKGALLLRRQPEANLAAYTECRYSDLLPVTGGTVLDVGAWMKGENVAGAYGIAVHYEGPGSLEDTDYVSFTGPKPRWEKCEARVVVPTWANQIRFALYAVGNKGTIYYDHVYCVPGNEAGERERMVSAKGMQAFVSPIGVMHASMKGDIAISRAEFVTVTQGKVLSMQSLGQGKVSASGREVKALGIFAEWAALSWLHYVVRAYEGRFGIGMDAEVASDRNREVAVDELLYVLEVGGQFGPEDPEVYGDNIKLDFKRGRKMKDVREVIFHGVRGDTLAVYFPDKASAMRIKRRGIKTTIEVILAETALILAEPVAISFEINSQSALGEIKLERLKNGLDVALKGGTAKQVLDILGELEAEYGKRKEIADLVQVRRRGLEARFEKEKLRLDTLMDSFRRAEEGEPFVVAKNAADKCIEEGRKYWAGTDQERMFDEAAAEIQKIVNSVAVAKREQEAREWLDKAYKMLDIKMYPVAKSYVDKLLEEYPNSEAAQKARDGNLLGVIQQALDRQEKERAFIKRIQDSISNWERNEQYDRALRIITADPEYPLYQDNPTIRKKVEELQTKAAAKRGE